MTTQIEIQRTPHIIAAEICSIKEQTKMMVLQNSIEIGRRLVEAKAMVAHGEWGKWLEESVDYSQSTANNLMKIYEEYGTDQIALFGSQVKSQALGNLGYTQAVALLGVPAEEREQFVQEHDVENLSTRELQKLVKEKQQLEKKLRDAEAKAEKERQERQKIAEQHGNMEKKIKEHDELVQRLNAELEKAKSSGDTKSAEKLKESLEKSKADLDASKKRVKELETELKKKPIDVPATTIIEKVPEEVERELAELREKVIKNDNKPAIKFAICFETLVSNFKDLLSSLDEIKQFKPEEHEKYQSAILGLMDKMTTRLKGEDQNA
ncbi:DUF3102 domain-containing protein [Paenibacillus tyrfis]|uniref:Preprotein translocase subunit SecA n=1 Tax=Paenibacillus tyrfis TaxID=1501230 RepID=A0A081NWN7_9BACL|nr:DUF3102 domain-containing protein [Paenibacillus tyrfis]KEQ22860.1 hypothetical protein ET33_21155 [Paenibacillus tyrfis]